MRYINPAVNLLEVPKQCCPFHTEDTPSFSFSADKGVWRCFGACHTGGDVIELARKHRKLSTREEAVEYLRSLLHLSDEVHIDFKLRSTHIDENKATVVRLVQSLERRCKGPDDWVAFDVAMSYHEPASEKVIRLRRLAQDKGWDLGGI